MYTREKKKAIEPANHCNPYVILKEKHLIDITDGQTPLHRCTSCIEITALENQYSETLLTHMARTPDTYGCLPIHYLSKDELSEAKNKIFKYTTARPETKPIKELIDIEKELKKYSFAKKKLKNNLEIAYKAINFVRSQIDFSSSHPDTNDLTEDEQKKLNLKIKKIREEKIYESKINKKCLKERIANCSEYTSLCQKIIYNTGYHFSLNVYRIINGDHTFLVLSEGKNAVVCDGWTGTAYPMYNITEKLFTHSTIRHSQGKKYFNITAAFVPEFHEIEKITDRSIPSRKSAVPSKIISFFFPPKTHPIPNVIEKDTDDEKENSFTLIL